LLRINFRLPISSVRILYMVSELQCLVRSLSYSERMVHNTVVGVGWKVALLFLLLVGVGGIDCHSSSIGRLAMDR